MVQLPPLQSPVQIHIPGAIHVPPLLQYSVQSLLATSLSRKPMHIRYVLKI